MQTSAITIFQVFLFKGVKCINHNFNSMWSCKNDVSLFMYLLPRMVVIFFPFNYFMFPPLSNHNAAFITGNKLIS